MRAVLLLSVVAANVVSIGLATAQVQDASKCFNVAERVRDGETIADEEKRAAHQACLNAFAATGNVVQKYQLQEADFDIIGTRPKQ